MSKVFLVKVNKISCFILICLFCFAICVKAEKINNISDVDKIFEKGGFKNFKKASTKYDKIVKRVCNTKAKSFDKKICFQASWKSSKALWWYGHQVKIRKSSNWKNIIAKLGKKGMEHAQVAIKLCPDKVQGHYFYGVNAGNYADGVSVITALSEGLKDKIKNNLKNAYKINKMYSNGGGIVALGRYWYLLPWPFRDTDKSYKYYDEFEQTKYFKYDDKAHIYFAELLIEIGGKKKLEKAKKILNSIINSDIETLSKSKMKPWLKRLYDNHKYYVKRAKKLLNDI